MREIAAEVQKSDSLRRVKNSILRDITQMAKVTTSATLSMMQAQPCFAAKMQPVRLHMRTTTWSRCLGYPDLELSSGQVPAQFKQMQCKN
jgi:hypothetical protein